MKIRNSKTIEYKNTPLSDICNIRNGFSFKSNQYSKNGIRVIRISDVQKGSISDNDVVYYPIELKREFENYLLNEDDILISLTGNVGRVAILKPSNLPAALNQRVAALVTNSNVINKYIYYCISNDNFEKQCIEASIGGAQKNLSTKWLANYIIQIPDKKVQEEIVEILDSFTNLIDALNEELSLRQKQFEYYREKLLTFDDNVKRLSFGNDFSLKARIGWQGLTKKEYRKTGDYYLITGTDFKEGNKIDFSTCVYVDEDRYTQDPNIQIKPNDVLITKDGTLGKVAFIERMDKPATLNGGVFVVRSKVNGVHPKYVAYYLSSSIFKNWIEQNHTNGSIMHLTQKMLVNFEIAMPSISIQQSMVSKLDAFESLISSLKEEIALRQKQYEYYREKLLTFD